MQFAATLALATAGFMLASGASAQNFQKPEDAIKYRRSSFTVLAAHFAHAASDRACAGALETVLHRLAKQLIADGHPVTLPIQRSPELLGDDIARIPMRGKETVQSFPHGWTLL